MHQLLENVPVISHLHHYLSESAPDEVLTFGLLGMAVIAVLVALFGDPLLKVAVLMYYILP